MKINRSSTVSLKYCNPSKIVMLEHILKEYGCVVNGYIDLFWEKCPSKNDLLKPVIDKVESWVSFRLKKVAAREAIDMVLGVQNRQDKKRKSKPVHAGKRMQISSTIAELGTETSEFDGWLKIRSIGDKIKLNLPFRRHRHFNKLDSQFKRLNAYVITSKSIQFCFERETGPKLEKDKCIGLDTGLNVLASVSTGEQYGTDIRSCVNRVSRCQHGSKGQQRAVRALRQRMNEVAKEVVTSGATLVVVEKLKGITHKTKVKRRLTKTMRRSLGHWNFRYWLTRLQQTCEDTNVSFRTVSPYNTSITCSQCGHAEKGNRHGQMFCCLKCGHQANADVQASRNILARFLTGPYGAGCKPFMSENGT